MTERGEKRHSEQGIAGLSGQGEADEQGVGARQGDLPLPPRGGGYLHICTGLNFCARAPRGDDPRIGELRRMGLPRWALAVAERLGVDSLLELWRIMDADPTSHGKEGRLVVTIRLYRSFLRFQRNRFIEALATTGSPPAEIQRRVQRQLGERISIETVRRISGQRRKGSAQGDRGLAHSANVAGE